MSNQSPLNEPLHKRSFKTSNFIYLNINGLYPNCNHTKVPYLQTIIINDENQIEKEATTKKMSHLNKLRLINDLLNIDSEIFKNPTNRSLDEENVAISGIKKVNKYFFKHAKKTLTIRN